MTDLTIEEVTIMLENEELLCQEKSGKSDVWLSFNEIINNDGQTIGFVICKNCQHVLKYEYSYGTSTLKRHKCPDKNEKQPKITSYWAKKQVSAAAKEQTTKKIV